MENANSVERSLEKRADTSSVRAAEVFTWKGAAEGARRTVPVALRTFAYGMVFEVLARQLIGG